MKNNKEIDNSREHENVCSTVIVVVVVLARFLIAVRFWTLLSSIRCNNIPMHIDGMRGAASYHHLEAQLFLERIRYRLLSSHLRRSATEAVAAAAAAAGGIRQTQL